MFDAIFINRTKLPRIDQLIGSGIKVSFNQNIYKISMVLPANLCVVPCKSALQKYSSIPLDIQTTVFLLKDESVFKYIRATATTLTENRPLILMCAGVTLDDAYVPYLKIFPNGDTEICCTSSTGEEKFENCYQLFYKYQ